VVGVDVGNKRIKSFNDIRGDSIGRRFEKMSSAYENEQKELTQRRNDLKAKIDRQHLCVSGRSNRQWSADSEFVSERSGVQ